MDVICIDDNRQELEFLLENCIKSKEFDTVHGFFSSKEALEYASSHKFEVVFCAMDPPKLNGIELTRSLRKINPKLNVILTASDKKYALDAFNSDCSGYLIKPLSEEMILHQLRILRFREKDERTFSD